MQASKNDIKGVVSLFIKNIRTIALEYHSREERAEIIKKWRNDYPGAEYRILPNFELYSLTQNTSNTCQ